MLAAGVLFASAHNWILFDAAWSPELQLTAASYAVYALLSWVTLAALYRPEGTRDLARIFLRLDLIAATLLVACTGGGPRAGCSSSRGSVSPTRSQAA
jgi:hypothetical protein